MVGMAATQYFHLSLQPVAAQEVQMAVQYLLV
jgi:hypothetical protein